MTMTANDIRRMSIQTWFQLNPEKDITAHDLWRCTVIGDRVDEKDLIPEDLMRHYQQRFF